MHFEVGMPYKKRTLPLGERWAACSPSLRVVDSLPPGPALILLARGEAGLHRESLGLRPGIPPHRLKGSCKRLLPPSTQRPNKETPLFLSE